MVCFVNWNYKLRHQSFFSTNGKYKYQTLNYKGNLNMNEDIVIKFWGFMSDAMFDGVGELIEKDANVWLPNTREVFRGRDKYIIFNKKYPGRWIITLDKIFSKDDMVISAVKVESEDKAINFYATSFFTIKNNLIHEITEYWGENNEPPIWRIEESLSERY